MGNSVILHLVFGVLAVWGVSLVNAEDPYLYFTWTVTYGTRSILGVPQQVTGSKPTIRRCSNLWTQGTLCPSLTESL
ncbi:hypothetical protein V6N13_070692 [Hibiscus sabdariffa]